MSTAIRSPSRSVVATKSTVCSQGKPDRHKAEMVCDYFAACLLMPRPWVKVAWSRGVQDVSDLAAVLLVSRTAMSLRLRQLGLVVSAGRCLYGQPTEPRHSTSAAHRDWLSRRRHYQASHYPFTPPATLEGRRTRVTDSWSVRPSSCMSVGSVPGPWLQRSASPGPQCCGS